MENKQTGISEIQQRSDIVTLLDSAINKVDDSRFIVILTINKRGGVEVDSAGYATYLEMNGLQVAVPELIEALLCENCGECDKCDHDA